MARYSLEALSRIASITRTVIPEIMERESPKQFLEIFKDFEMFDRDRTLGSKIMI